MVYNVTSPGQTAGRGGCRCTRTGARLHILSACYTPTACSSAHHHMHAHCSCVLQLNTTASCPASHHHTPAASRGSVWLGHVAVHLRATQGAPSTTACVGASDWEAVIWQAMDTLSTKPTTEQHHLEAQHNLVRSAAGHHVTATAAGYCCCCLLHCHCRPLHSRRSCAWLRVS